MLYEHGGGGGGRGQRIESVLFLPPLVFGPVTLDQVVSTVILVLFFTLTITVFHKCRLLIYSSADSTHSTVRVKSIPYRCVTVKNINPWRGEGCTLERSFAVTECGSRCKKTQ